MGNLLALIGAYLIFVLALWVFLVIVQWKIFTKAGQPGWAVLIPFYNLYVYTKVIQRPSWWIWIYIGCIITSIIIVGYLALLVFAILDTIRLAKVFGKESGFAVGLIFLPIIFMPMLAFGDAKYVGINTNNNQ